MSEPQGTVYIISDGTGETAATMVRAALVQYPDQDINIVRCKNVRTEEQVEGLIEQVAQNSGIVVHTVVSKSLRRSIETQTAAKNISCVDLLGPLLESMSIYLGQSQAVNRAGGLHSTDERYFKRVEAIEFTVKHDDGKVLHDLDLADIILVGISRTSKTPLSIFLSHKGFKVANVPLVWNSPLPEELQKVDQRKVVGLIIDGDALFRIRRKRLEKFGQDPGSEYASMAHISREIEYALSLYKANRKWPVFDVTDRALEETAGDIIRIVGTRMGWPFETLL